MNTGSRDERKMLNDISRIAKALDTIARVLTEETKPGGAFNRRPPAGRKRPGTGRPNDAPPGPA